MIAPVLLLLLMQIRFLPFHYSLITWIHRLALVLDLALIWWLWGKILSAREAKGGRRWAAWAKAGLGAVLGACAVLFSWTAATFPGEWQEDHWLDWRLFPTTVQIGDPKKVSLHDFLFSLPVDDVTGRRASIFSNTLVLRGLDIYEGLRSTTPTKLGGPSSPEAVI